MALCCPTCGHGLDDVPPAILKDLPLQRQVLLVIYELVDAYPRSVSVEKLIDTIWGKVADGGPDSPEKVLRTRISHVRKAIAPYGWSIPRMGAGSSFRYRLEKLP